MACNKPNAEQLEILSGQTINQLNACIAAAGDSMNKIHAININVRFYCQQNGIPALPDQWVRGLNGNITDDVLGENKERITNPAAEINPNTGKPISRPKPIEPDSDESEQIRKGIEDGIGKAIDNANKKKRLCPAGSAVATQIAIQCKNTSGQPGVGYTDVWYPSSS